MNRLFTRIFLAMLTVTVISLIAVPLTQSFLTKRTINEQTTEFRELLEQRTSPSGPRDFFVRPNRTNLTPRNNQGDNSKDNYPKNNQGNNSKNDRNGSNQPRYNPPRPQQVGSNQVPPPPFAIRLDDTQELIAVTRFGIDPNYAVTEDEAVGFQEILRTPQLQRQLTAALQGTTVVQRQDSNLNERLLSVFGSYRSSVRQGILIGIPIAALVSILLATWLARALSKPLEAVSGAASTIAQGDLSSRVLLKRLAQQPKETQALASSFNDMAESLESAQEERKAMIADIAHELRNPLATMQFRIEALQDGLLEPSQKEFTVLNDQVGLLSRLVDDLRTLSLADAGQLSLNIEEFDLRVLLEGLKLQWQERADRQNVQISLESTVEGAMIQADSDRVSQVMHNLISNALKVMPDGGDVYVSLTSDAKHYKIAVEDTGPGIAEDKLEVLFERFVQGERRDVKGKENSGLGLAIVKTFVELHGGSVRASNGKVGAKFDVSLPA